MTDPGSPVYQQALTGIVVDGMGDIVSRPRMLAKHRVSKGPNV